ncbi:hypothetical protein [Streptomyces sp. NBC_00199]|uniref:hypothetical protein n=1 Tax=Streptomyces sp. NBC_00199 TaxID=2975678 RepID=UPI00225A0C2D|nr:hypothetical protein [Streptomyces sp. NBC_00199]MCX5264622.1 hypothetical protein [Streptomyces sp. NBC_00199]
MARAGAEVRVAGGEDGTIRITAARELRPTDAYDGNDADDGTDADGDAEAYGDVDGHGDAGGHRDARSHGDAGSHRDHGAGGRPVPVGADFTSAVLDVAGAVLSRPVLADPGLPSAWIHDVERAQHWLWALYGERVAAAVHAHAAGETAEVRVRAQATALGGAAARLGLGHWAARWWPASHSDGIAALEPDVLGLELAALTHRCQQLFDGEDDQPDDCAAALIEEHRTALDALVQWWHAAPGPSDTARRLEGVLRLIDAAADNTGLDGPALRRLRSALERRGPAGAPTPSGGPAAEGAPGAAEIPAGLAALLARPGGYALAAGERIGAAGRVIARGSGTNDWRRYPPGFVDAAENAVSWTARALGARRHVEAQVVAHPAEPTAGATLVAEVHVDGGGPHRIPLTRQDDVWTGHTDLTPQLSTGAVSPRVEVGVLLPGFDPGSPGARESAADRDRRDAVRAMVRRRLTAAATSPVVLSSAAHDRSPLDACSAPFLAETAAAATDEDY